MSDKFESAKETKVKDETVTDKSAHERVERVADKAAEKSSKTAKDFDKDNSKIFNK